MLPPKVSRAYVRNAKMYAHLVDVLSNSRTFCHTQNSKGKNMLMKRICTYLRLQQEHAQCSGNDCCRKVHPRSDLI